MCIILLYCQNDETYRKLRRLIVRILNERARRRRLRRTTSMSVMTTTVEPTAAPTVATVRADAGKATGTQATPLTEKAVTSGGPFEAPNATQAGGGATEGLSTPVEDADAKMTPSTVATTLLVGVGVTTGAQIETAVTSEGRTPAGDGTTVISATSEGPAAAAGTTQTEAGPTEALTTSLGDAVDAEAKVTSAAVATTRLAGGETTAALAQIEAAVTSEGPAGTTAETQSQKHDAGPDDGPTEIPVTSAEAPGTTGVTEGLSATVEDAADTAASGLQAGARRRRRQADGDNPDDDVGPYDEDDIEFIENPDTGAIEIAVRDKEKGTGEIPHGLGQFWRLAGSSKNIGGLCCGVCSRKGHSILNNSMTANCNASTSWCYITLSPVKIRPFSDAAFCQNSVTTCLLSFCYFAVD